MDGAGAAGFEGGRPPPLFGRLRSSSGQSEGAPDTVMPLSDLSPSGEPRMRIAIFAPAYATGEGSSALAVRDLVRFFRTQSDLTWLVVTVSPERFGTADDDEYVLACEPGTMLAPAVSLPYMHEHGGYRFCPGLGGQLLCELEHFRPDVLHLTEPCILSLHALQWARVRKVPVMATFHGELHAQLRALAVSSGPPGALLLFMYERYLHNFYGQVPRIFVPSTQLQYELWAAGYGERGMNEVGVCGATVDLQRFTPAARSASVRAALGARDESTILVLWLGPASQVAGADVWAYVLSRLRADGAPVAGVVVGAGSAPQILRAALPRVPVTVATDERVRRGCVDMDGTANGESALSPGGELADRTERASAAAGLASAGGFNGGGGGGGGAGAQPQRGGWATGPCVSAPLESILASCDMLLCPAAIDPFCVHLLRALASGLAVVIDADAATRLSDLGLADVHDAVLALPAAAHDVDGCYAATSALVRDHALASRLRRVGRRTVQRAVSAPPSPSASPHVRATAGSGGAPSARGRAHVPLPLSPLTAPAVGCVGGWTAHHARLVAHYRESVDLGRLRPPRPLRADRKLHNVFWLCACACFSSSAKALQMLRARGAGAHGGGCAARLAARTAHATLLLVLPLALLCVCAGYMPLLLLMQLAWCIETMAPQPNTYLAHAAPPAAVGAARGLASGGVGVLASLLRAARASVTSVLAPARRLPSSGSLPAALAAAGAAGGAGTPTSSSTALTRLRRAGLALGAVGVLLVGLYAALVVVLQAHTSRHAWQEHEFWCHDVRGVCERRIPFIVHQMYKNEALPEEWAETPATWQRMNPGYKYMLWTDRELRELIENHYAWFLPVYLAYPHNIQRSDSSRYFLLHRYGGIYADLDIVSTRSIDRLIAGHEALLPLTPNIGITNAVMASTPGHEFFGYVIKELERYSSTWYHGTRHVTIVTSTGPTFLWSAFLHYTGKNAVALVPAAVWGKCTVCHPHCAEMAGAFFRHLSGGSWHTGDSKAINNGLICHPILLMVLALLALSAIRRRITWLPLGAVAAVYFFQDWLDVDMWFAPFAWLMGVGRHGTKNAPKLLPGEQPGAEQMLDAKERATNDPSRPAESWTQA
ncbi:hypothetical protein KFE25_001165 [Diacronema lutheri]|uniref:Glycosyltransferase subfamily 4-like N-terminal domain-containing protein n=1 Tax=Diacronema lutheri TaxID=2081491 RepID=A0A8J5X5K6_DIALT|nr:hypothetical protein KFE25_001165 [Diacronema lutheri]